jgi:hypothetical protein
LLVSLLGLFFLPREAVGLDVTWLLAEEAGTIFGVRVVRLRLEATLLAK